MAEPEPTRAKPRGLFLSLDGTDGGGKTTQLARLAAWLSEQGYEVVTCRDPGGSSVGEQVREILLNGKKDHLSLRAEMLLFMASRAQLVDEVIRPALDRGAIVLSDRYLLANLVYQGYAGGLPLEEVAKVGQVATGGLFPDLTILLDVPIEVARTRMGKVRDRIEERPETYHAKVREGFLRAAAERDSTTRGLSYGPIVIVDASAAPESVAAQIRSEVERALALGPRT